uniref:Uncharacterized protein n=1 Tax=Kalanchoe fedtschenkoi TaxID=63787 RepID=A0A7N1A302_KALFE
MSLRHGSRIAYQLGVRAMQGAKDRAASRWDTASAVKSLHDTSSGTKARRFSTAVDSSNAGVRSEPQRRRQAEESLRTVMFLSCWGPN